MSSDEIEQAYPHATSIVRRGSWFASEHLDLNGFVQGLGRYRSGSFNNLHTYRFARGDQAAALTEYCLVHRLHRLAPNSMTGAEHHEIADEWVRLADERETILDWARKTRFLQEVLQGYRFERNWGSYSSTAHEATRRLIETRYPEIPDPLNYAGVIIVSAERASRLVLALLSRPSPALRGTP